MKDFENMIEELSRITEKLEGGELSLAESVELFEKGVTLTKKCNEILTEAEGKVVKITKDAEGNVKEVPFSVEEA